MILSLDLATKKTGYAIMKDDSSLVEYGLIRTFSNEPRDRIKEIYFGVENIIKNNEITHIICEDVPINNHNNLKTGKDLCILQGAILTLGFLYGINFTFYNPSSWRSIIGLYDGTREGTKRAIQKQKAVNKVNEIYKLNLVYYEKENKNCITDDDKAEAICLGLAYIKAKEE